MEDKIMNYSLCFGIKGPCVPLEYTLKFKYKFNGILFEQYNTYIQEHTWSFYIETEGTSLYLDYMI